MAHSAVSERRSIEGNRAAGMATSTEVQKALRTGDIWPAFQPLVDVNRDVIIGFEILARWTDPVLGNIPPSDFIQVAEEAGLINDLTEHLIASACSEAVTWGGDFILAFNISPAQFRNDGLYDLITSTIRSTGFPLHRIHIEITEGALLSNEAIVHRTIEQFKLDGMGIALDDFGTGYASLTQLRSFPFDKIKIDMSFVQVMETDSGCRKIVTAVVGLGQSLGMTVVAEGVETNKQADILRELGCDVGQGWLFGKPLAASETKHFLSSRKHGRLAPRRPLAS